MGSVLFTFACFGLLAQSVAASKGVPASKWSAISVVLGPAALLIAVNLPDVAPGETVVIPAWLDTLHASVIVILLIGMVSWATYN
jgi:hypothetical protein